MYIVLRLHNPDARLEHARDVPLTMLAAFKRLWQAKLYLHKEGMRALRLLSVTGGSGACDAIDSPLLSSASLREREGEHTLMFGADDTTVNLVRIVRGWSSVYPETLTSFYVQHCPVGADHMPPEPTGHEHLAPVQSFRVQPPLLQAPASEASTPRGSDSDTMQREQRWGVVMGELGAVLRARRASIAGDDDE